MCRMHQAVVRRTAGNHLILDPFCVVRLHLQSHEVCFLLGCPPCNPEDQLQKRQRYVTGLPDSIFDGRNIQQLRSEHVLKAFRNLCGHSNVIHAQVKYWQPRQCSTEFAEVVAAVVEFKDVKTAELVSSKQQMLLIEGSDWQEQVLQMNEIGGLRAALATDTNRYVRYKRSNNMQ